MGWGSCSWRKGKITQGAPNCSQGRGRRAQRTAPQDSGSTHTEDSAFRDEETAPHHSCSRPSQNASSRGISAAQWLGLCTSTAEGVGSIPAWGAKIPPATWRGQKNKATYEKLQVTAKVECCWEKSREKQGVQRRLVKQGGAGRSQRRGTALGTTSHTQHKTLQRKSEGRGALATSMAAASSKQCPAPDKRNSSYGGESLPAPISRHTTVLHNMCGSKK